MFSLATPLRLCVMLRPRSGLKLNCSFAPFFVHHRRPQYLWKALGTQISTETWRAIAVVHNVRPAGHIRSAKSRHVARHAQQVKWLFPDTALTFTPQWRKPLISQHLNELNLKVQGENQLVYHLAKHVSDFNLSIQVKADSLNSE